MTSTQIESSWTRTDPICLMEIFTIITQKMLFFQTGDPSVFGNLNPPEIVINAVEKSVRSGKYNGYAASCSG